MFNDDFAVDRMLDAIQTASESYLAELAEAQEENLSRPEPLFVR
jgi:hypothetical protein